MVVLPITAGGAINVIPVPLRRDDPLSPWCYAATITPPLPLELDDEDPPAVDDNTGPSRTYNSLLPPGANFLATQVWPSSRIASNIIEKYMDPSWTVCELGCGPGLPSLTAAKVGARRVIATDVDKLALEMVHAAAAEQGFVETQTNDDIAVDANREILQEQRFATKQIDLTSREHPLPEADLYVLSDVFESSAVAEGAAWHVQSVLSKNRQVMVEEGNTKKKNIRDEISRVWVFAQSDRAQRDSFLGKMSEWYKNDNNGQHQQLVGWTMDHTPNHDKELLLFDLDETMVEYN